MFGVYYQYILECRYNFDAFTNFQCDDDWRILARLTFRADLFVWSGREFSQYIITAFSWQPACIYRIPYFYSTTVTRFPRRIPGIHDRDDEMEELTSPTLLHVSLLWMGPGPDQPDGPAAAGPSGRRRPGPIHNRYDWYVWLAVIRYTHTTIVFISPCPPTLSTIVVVLFARI